MVAILSIAQLKKMLNIPKVASSRFFISRVYFTRKCKKNICYVPKWGGAQKGDFATVLLCTICQKCGQEKEERRTLEKVWRTMTLCDANYAMKERSDVKVTETWFEDLSLHFHLA